MSWDETEGWIFSEEAHIWMDQHICSVSRHSKIVANWVTFEHRHKMLSWKRIKEKGIPSNVMILGLAQFKDSDVGLGL